MFKKLLQKIKTKKALNDPRRFQTIRRKISKEKAEQIIQERTKQLTQRNKLTIEEAQKRALKEINQIYTY
jgi:hypothetical protein